MPTSTLHKSAQQGAPEAYISMCKSTTKDTRVQKIHASASLCASKRCPHRPRHTRVQEDTRVGLLLRAPKMTAPTWTRAKMHASPLLPASQRCARLGGYGASTESSLPPIF